MQKHLLYKETLAREQFVNVLVNFDMRLKIEEATLDDLNDAL